MLSSMLRRVGATLVRPSTAAATLAARTLRTTTPVAHGDFEWQVRRETGVRLTGDSPQDPKSEEEVVNVTYVLRDGTERQIRGKVGDNCMYLAHR